jgi:hypothetical protein
MLRVGVLANPWIWVGVAVILLLHLLFIYLPGLPQLCHSAPWAFPPGSASWLLDVSSMPWWSLKKRYDVP